MLVPPEMAAFAALMAGTGDTAVSLDDLAGRPPWHADALCREYPEVDFFPVGASPRREAPAKAVCARCLVRAECALDAMSDPGRVGIWGGTSRGERTRLRAALRQRDAA